MKTITKKGRGWLSITLMALISVATLFGCGKKGSNNANPYLYGYGANPNCANCGGANQLLKSGLGQTQRSYVNLQMGLDFYGAGANTGYATPYGGVTYQNQVNYSGAITASGRMRVVQPDVQCGIPAGDYAIGTSSAGQYANGIIRGLTLQATGPVALVITFPNTYIDDTQAMQVGFDGRQYPSRVVNDIMINNCRYVLDAY